MTIAANQFVSFQQQATQEVIGPYWVAVEPLGPDSQVNLASGGYQYDYEAVWDDPLQFSDGQFVRQGDFLLWDFLPNKLTELRYVRHFAIPNQHAQAHFKET